MEVEVGRRIADGLEPLHLVVGDLQPGGLLAIEQLQMSRLGPDDVLIRPALGPRRLAEVTRADFVEMVDKTIFAAATESTRYALNGVCFVFSANHIELVATDADDYVRKAAAIATDAIDADALKTDAITEIADGLLNRDMSTGTDSGSPTVRTVRQALRFLRNKWSLSGTTLSVCKEDDATASWTAQVTTDAAANPVTGNDPHMGVAARPT